jgi:hypothetical protein
MDILYQFNDWIQQPYYRHAIVYALGIIAGLVMLGLLIKVRQTTLKAGIITAIIIILISLQFGASTMVLADFVMDDVIADNTQEFVNWTHTPMKPETIIEIMNKAKDIDKAVYLPGLHEIVELYTTPLGPSWVLVDEGEYNVLEFQTEPPIYCPKLYNNIQVTDNSGNELWEKCK